jgi:Xaa-Pro aminopeptidase
MGAARDAARHAGTLYRKTLAWLRFPVREIEAEAEHLREVEREGERAETPIIAIFGIILFLLPIVVLILGLVFAAYYLAR